MNPELFAEEWLPQDENADSVVIAISSDAMGRGDEELGKVLLRNYIHTLTDIAQKPRTLIFFNAGVTLATEGSPLLADLSTLRDQGVRILLCGTCLAHYDLKEQVRVGEISNMYAISETMLKATKVINL
jgi:selenium metabolism protein YedF